MSPLYSSILGALTAVLITAFVVICRKQRKNTVKIGAFIFVIMCMLIGLSGSFLIFFNIDISKGWNPYGWWFLATFVSTVLGGFLGMIIYGINQKTSINKPNARNPQSVHPIFLFFLGNSPSFKAKVALSAIRNEETIAQLAAKYEPLPTMINNWKKALLEGASVLFDKGQKACKHHDATVNELYKFCPKRSVFKMQCAERDGRLEPFRTEPSMQAFDY